MKTVAQAPTLIKLILLACATWVGSLLVYLTGIMITAASLEQVQTSTASTATLILIAVELLMACISIAFVYTRSRGYARAGVRFVYMGVFALLQLGTCVLAIIISLLALNR